MRRFLTVLAAALALLAGAAGQARAENIFVLTTQNQIFSFDSATPGAATLPRNVTGLQTGEVLLGIDIRPRDGQIYGLTSNNRIYTINPMTGAATLVSTLSQPLQGSAFGIDFNPIPDTAGLASYRVVSNANTNLRINADTGLVNMDGNLQFNQGSMGTPPDPNSAQNPNIEAVAYSNNFFGNVAGNPGTTLFGIDTNLGVLVTVNPPNNGTLNTIGPILLNGTGPNVGISELATFDISGLTGTAYAALNITGGNSSLYTINLSTGAATFVGLIGNGFQIRGLAAPIGTPVPEPATLTLFGAGLASLAGYARRRKRNI
jgi:hypothetical protein